MTFFDDKPFVLQILDKGDWFTSDWFATVDEAREIAKKKTSPWRIIRHSTGAVVGKGTPVHLHTTASPDPEEVFDIFRFQRFLRSAPIMLLQCEVIVLEIAVVTQAEIWQESDGDERERASAKMVLYDALLSAANIEIRKRLQSQYVPLCEN